MILKWGQYTKSIGYGDHLTPHTEELLRSAMAGETFSREMILTLTGAQGP